MATPRRTQSPTIAEQLFEEGYRFEFHQAVKLLEKLISEPVPEDIYSDDEFLEQLATIANSNSSGNEPVQFRSTVSNAFPASDVEHISLPTEAGQPLTMDVNFMGLAGAHGPLPPPYTELIIERVWHSDTALRDFLDLFNHRLVSLFYNVRKQHRIGLEVHKPWESQFAQHLFALLGLGTPGLQQRMQLDDHSLLFYSGLFVHESRSISSLENLLSDYFQTPIGVEPFIGQWQYLLEDDYTRIGVNGQNQALGQTTTIGTRVWDLQGKIALLIGPLDFKQLLKFLPTGLGFLPLCELTRFFLGAELDFEINLLLKGAEIPATQLSNNGQARLGWTTWIKNQSNQNNQSDSSLKLSSRLFYDAREKSAIPLLESLQRHELETVLTQMVPHNLSTHTKVIKQGELGNSLFIIQRGEVQVRYQGLDGKPHILATLGAGQFFGEMSLLTGKPRSATVITLSACHILELSRQHLDSIAEQHPKVKKMLEKYYQLRVFQL